MKHLFIIHGLARADKKKRKAFDRLMAGIDRLEGDVEVQYTDPPDWGAEQIARAWAQRGDPLRIYACGGDGTLNEVVLWVRATTFSSCSVPATGSCFLTYLL